MPSRRGDIDAVAHQIAVGLLDNVAQMNANPELDTSVRRYTRVSDFDRAAHCVEDAAELDDVAVAGALNDAPMMRGDGGIDEILRRPRRRTKVRSSSAAASRL